MKIFVSLILFTLFISGCTKEHKGLEAPTGVNMSLDSIYLSTDKTSYSTTDSIHLTLVNKVGSDIEVGYRCTYRNLEMYYQRKENDGWSDNQWFDYMALKCMTIPKTLKSNTKLKHSISSQIFKSAGIFRLLLPCFITKRDSTIVVISNSFAIE